MQRHAGLTAIATFAVLAAAGCSAPDNPKQNPPMAASSEPTSSSDNPAGKVEKPKNLASITNACDVLTKQQLTALGEVNGKAPRSETSATGYPKCQWSNDNFGLIVGVDYVTGTGAERIVEKAKSSSGGPLTVDGYPAARIYEQSVLCRIEVGVSDKQIITVEFTRHNEKDPAMQDPCGYAKKIASEVLKKLPDA